jgi:hypothetical protein
MPKLDEKRFPPPPSERGGVWSLAALSVAALCCSVLGARLLAEMVEQNGANAIITNHSEERLRQIAASAPHGQPRQTVTIIRSIGVDGTTTATIPGHSGVKLDPCGDSAR